MRIAGAGLVHGKGGGMMTKRLVNLSENRWSGRYLQILQNEANGGKCNRCEEIGQRGPYSGSLPVSAGKRGDGAYGAREPIFHGFVWCQH